MLLERGWIGGCEGQAGGFSGTSHVPPSPRGGYMDVATLPTF